MSRLYFYPQLHYLQNATNLGKKAVEETIEVLADKAKLKIHQQG